MKRGDNVLEYWYDEHGNTLQHTNLESDETYDHDNFYDENGNLRKVITTSGNYENVCKYDEKNRFISEFDNNGNSKVITYYDDNRYKMQSNNHDIDHIKYDIEDNQSLKLKTQNDVILNKQKTSFDLTIKNVNRNTISEYDSAFNGTVIAEKEFDEDNKLIRTAQYRLCDEQYIDYDENNNICNIDTYSAESSKANMYNNNDSLSRNLILSVKRDLEYDNQNRVIKSESKTKLAKDIPSTGWYQDNDNTNLFSKYCSKYNR